ncbi:MAG: hypothetical protein ACREGR_05055 [Minisyncoccia bacterium]
MRYALFLLAFAFPAGALAAPAATSTFLYARNLALTEGTRTNAYYAAGSLSLSGATGGDLLALAGSMNIAGAVAGDALLAGGILTLHAPVAGDLRALGARLSIDTPVAGDLVAVAGSVSDSAGGERDAFIIAGSAALLGGAAGPVTVYGNTVTLGGDFAGDVQVAAAGSLTLSPGTVIHGTLDYQAPEQASVPDSVKIEGGSHYGGAPYLSTGSQSRAIALAGIGVFLLVKILGALILAGLLAGLFPVLAERVASEAAESTRRLVLTTLLGFALLVAVPVLLLLLALTFVGWGLAAVLGAAYILFALLSFAYTGIVFGSALARAFSKRETIFWHDAVLGMLIVCLLTIVPVAGLLLVGVLAAFCAGALARIFYQFAFPRDSETAPLL